ncbi:MAG: OmpA family protein [bacterium]|nr:OmpA family protein [bacterium]MBU1917119.1 OmpA family protein [bacterium]
MMKRILGVLVLVGLLLVSFTAQSAYVSRFDAVNFDPVVDGGDYFSVYGSQSLKAWQGNTGIIFDYAYRPLEFRSTGGTSTRQSVLDHSFIMNTYGAIGLVDWLTVGVNLPSAYNIYYTDDVNAADDSGMSMGDMTVMAKFRAVDIDKYKVGLSFMPFVTLPTGDVVRYMGNGHVTGGLKILFDVAFHKRFSMALNAGYLMRDDVTRVYNFANLGTATIRIDDEITYGIAANFKASRYFQLIAEAQGYTQALRDIFGTSNTTALEAGAGMRYFIGDSGFALSLGGAAGLIEGVGTPLFRGFFGVNWKSPESRECPPCAPDPRIKDNKIVIWGKIFFDTAKASIKRVSFPVLDDVVDVLKTHPEIRLVEVQGHCDWRGGDVYNMNLSQRRSESVRQYLIDAGIDGSRLTAKGYGESQPIASNDTVEGMSQNRRVEFVILQSSGGYTTNPNAAEYKDMPYQPVHKIENGLTVAEEPVVPVTQANPHDIVTPMPGTPEYDVTEAPVAAPVQPTTIVQNEPMPKTQTVPVRAPVQETESVFVDEINGIPMEEENITDARDEEPLPQEKVSQPEPQM